VVEIRTRSPDRSATVSRLLLAGYF